MQLPSMGHKVQHSRSRGFKVGDVVWAKVQNPPAWPAKVTEPDDSNKAGLHKHFGSLTTAGLHVTFYGDKSVVHVKACNVKAFEQVDEPSSGRALRHAVQEVNSAIERLAESKSAHSVKTRRQQ
ncbi:hypothetical protein ABBQ32_013332 [Trebouxia sp. C0010 RCD-2024]